jgi:hypothetical protein
MFFPDPTDRKAKANHRDRLSFNWKRIVIGTIRPYHPVQTVLRCHRFQASDSDLLEIPSIRSLNNRLNMRPVNPEPGKWYVAMTCQHCEYQIILFEDFTAGRSDFTKGTATLTCSKCKQEFKSHLEHYRYTGNSQGSGK